jgi:cell division protein FtsB
LLRTSKKRHTYFRNGWLITNSEVQFDRLNAKIGHLKKELEKIAATAITIKHLEDKMAGLLNENQRLKQQVNDSQQLLNDQ